MAGGCNSVQLVQDDQTVVINRLCIAMIILSTVFIILRAWAKILFAHSTIHRLGWDDFFAFITYVGTHDSF
jgi:hypothetical protein